MHEPSTATTVAARSRAKLHLVVPPSRNVASIDPDGSTRATQNSRRAPPRPRLSHWPATKIFPSSCTTAAFARSLPVSLTGREFAPSKMNVESSDPFGCCRVRQKSLRSPLLHEPNSTNFSSGSTTTPAFSADRCPVPRPTTTPRCSNVGSGCPAASSREAQNATLLPSPPLKLTSVAPLM